MSHTHEYRFWHAHKHTHEQTHKDAENRIVSAERYSAEHNTGHYHLNMQTHDHGSKSDRSPHAHKGKQDHPETDEENEVHHHAPADHEKGGKNQ